MEVGAGKHISIAQDANGNITFAAGNAILSGVQIRYEAERDSLGYRRAAGDKSVYDCLPQTARIPHTDFDEPA